MADVQWHVVSTGYCAVIGKYLGSKQQDVPGQSRRRRTRTSANGPGLLVVDLITRI